MTNDSDVSEMHKEVSRLLSEMGDFSLDNDGLCSLKIDGHVSITFESPRDAPYFMLHSSVTVIAPGSKSDVFERALSINFDRYSDIGLRLRFKKDTGDIVLLFTSDHAAYDLTDFSQAIVLFGQKAKETHDILLSEPSEGKLQIFSDEHLIRI